MPAISIILPVYNGMKYLPQSVDSVLSQHWVDFEFLILDDCSTDGSWEWLQLLKDTRIKLFRNEQNKGLFYNLNFLINISGSSLIKLWSQDDVLYPHCLEQVIAFHRLHPEIGFSYTGRDYIDAGGNEISIQQQDDTPEIISPVLHARIAFFTGSIAGNIANTTLCKSALTRVGLFNEQMKISGDFDMWVRLAKDHHVGFIRQALVQLRNHREQLSGQEKYYINHVLEDILVYRNLLSYVNEKQQKEGWQLLRNYKLLFYYTLMIKAFLKGNIKTGWAFLTSLNRFDSIVLLTGYFIKNRIFSRKIGWVDKRSN